jgi:hypothetical protein
VGRGKINGEGEGGQIWSMYFVYMYENRTMKPAGIVLKRQGKGMRENDGGSN